MNTSDRPLHVIAGAGQIGPLVAERLRARGLAVRLLRRSAAGPSPKGGEVRQVDLSDPAQAAAAMAGAQVVYHCANPLYHRWGAELLPLNRGIAAGAARVGARLVVLDNTYMYGAPGAPFREDSPVAPCSRKGRLRAQAADELLSAHRRGDLRVALARASDFFGPHARVTGIFSERFWRRLLAGRPVEVLGDADQPHSYSCTTDIADGLVALGLAGDEDYGQVWHLPVLPAEPTRSWVQRFAEAARPGQPVRMQRLSRTALRLIGLFMPPVRELPEMVYQWEAPLVLEDRRFRQRFSVEPTPASTVAAAAAAWALQTFGGEARGSVAAPA